MSELIRKHPTLEIEVSSYGRVKIPATKNSKEHWTSLLSAPKEEK